MKKELLGVTFENCEVFEDWIRENHKNDFVRETYFSFDGFYEDLLRHTEETGSTSYEIDPWFSKSRHAEEIHFHRRDVYVLGDERVDPDEMTVEEWDAFLDRWEAEDGDEIETTIIF